MCLYSRSSAYEMIRNYGISKISRLPIVSWGGGLFVNKICETHHLFLAYELDKIFSCLFPDNECQSQILT